MSKSSSEISDGIVDAFESKLGHHGLAASGAWLRMKIHEAVKEEQDRTRVANLQLRALEKVARRIVADRACVCNVTGHRCGTNQMLDDIDYALGRTK